MASSTEAQQPQSSPTQFTLFPSLPAELRIQIWNASFLPRVVELHLSSVLAGQLVEGSAFERLTMWLSKCSNSAALSVCSEARTLAQAHFAVVLPLSTLRIGIGPCPRRLYLDPTSDLLVFLGDVNFIRISELFQTVQELDPAGRRLQRFGINLDCWASNETWKQVLFSQLDELALLMYAEYQPPASFQDGECAVEVIRGLVGTDAFTRLLSAYPREIHEHFNSGRFKLMNLDFIHGPKTRHAICSASSAFPSNDSYPGCP
ncbi:hypothetical protein F4819DRAFT_355440 [Hypoxylon fuscum]|nr:hypothetical protein F4819DRAFT_355440 [Hypoxylon fuscum]